MTSVDQMFQFIVVFWVATQIYRPGEQLEV